MAKKKRYIVVAREGNVVDNGLTLGDKHVSFHGKTAKSITDPALARDIDSTHGLKADGKVWVAQDERFEHSENYHPDSVHKYFWGANRKYAAGWERIFGKKPKRNAKKAAHSAEVSDGKTSDGVI